MWLSSGISFGNRMSRNFVGIKQQLYRRGLGGRSGTAFTAETQRRRGSQRIAEDRRGLQRTAEDCRRGEAFAQRAGIFDGTAARAAPRGLPSGSSQKKIIRARGGLISRGVPSSAFLRVLRGKAVAVALRLCGEAVPSFTPNVVSVPVRFIRQLRGKLLMPIRRATD